MPLLPSIPLSMYLRPILLLFYYFGDLFPFFSKRQPETSETYVQLVTCIEMLNRHSDDNSSRTMPIKAFLYLMYLSRRFPPLILSCLHLSRLAHWDLLLSIASPESMIHQSVRLQFFFYTPHRLLASISFIFLLAFCSFPLLSWLLYDFNVSVSFIRILNISQTMSEM